MNKRTRLKQFSVVAEDTHLVTGKIAALRTLPAKFALKEATLLVLQLLQNSQKTLDVGLG